MTYDYMAKGRGVHGEVMDGWMLPDILAPGTSNIHTAPPLLPGATSQHQINLNKPIQDGGDADAPLWLREAIKKGA